MTAPVEPMTVPYDAHRACSGCGMPSPRVLMCGECEIAARGDAVIDDHLAVIDALRAEVAKLTAELEEWKALTITGRERHEAADTAWEKLLEERDTTVAAQAKVIEAGVVLSRATRTHFTGGAREAFDAARAALEPR